MKTDSNQRLLSLLAKNVRRLRKSIGLSQEELAFECDIDRTYISKVERGIANPSLLILSKISVVLGVEIQDLIKKR